MADGLAVVRYPFILVPVREELGGGWYAQIPQLPGCVATAATIDRTIELLARGQEVMVADSEDEGEEVPDPLMYGDNTIIQFHTEGTIETLNAILWQDKKRSRPKRKGKTAQ